MASKIKTRLFPFSKVFPCAMIGTVLIVLLLLPSVNDPELVHATITAKTLFFVYGLLILLALSVLSLLFTKQTVIKWKISRIDASLLVLFVYIVVNRYFVQLDFGFSVRFIEFLGLSFLYLVLRTFSLKIYPWLLLTVTLSGIVQAVYGNLQLLGYYPSLHSGFAISGSYFNPGPYAGFLAAVWPVALGLYFYRDRMLALVLSHQGTKKGLKHKIVQFLFTYVPLIGMATIMVVLPATRSRAAWLAVLSATLILTAHRYKVWEKIRAFAPFKKILIASLASIVLTTGLYGIYHFKKGSADGRMLIWKVTTDIIKENPVFGVGHDRFKAYYMNAQGTYFSKNGETPETMVADNTYYAFNEPLQFISENGLAGFFLIIVIVYFLYRSRIGQGHGFLKVCSISVLCCLFVFGLFSYPLQILPIKLVWVLVLALMAGIGAKKTGHLFSDRTIGFLSGRKIVWAKIGLLVVVAVVIVQVYSEIKKSEKGFKGWKTALDTYNYGLYEDSIAEFEKVYPILQKEGDFLMNYGKALTMAEQYKKAIAVLERAKQYLNTTIIETALGDAHKAEKHYKEAEGAYTRAANMLPGRFYPHYLLAKLYEESGQKEKALKKAKEILEKKIKVPSRAIEEIKAEMVKILNKKPPEV